MSGSGGFYKYRCKYFLTHNCPNWVFVNHAPCADCCAAGRDAEHADDDDGDTLSIPEMEIGVPVFRDGILHYALMQVLVRTDPESDFRSWTLHHQPPPYELLQPSLSFSRLQEQPSLSSLQALHTLQPSQPFQPLQPHQPLQSLHHPQPHQQPSLQQLQLQQQQHHHHHQHQLLFASTAASPTVQAPLPPHAAQPRAFPQQQTKRT